MECLCFAEGYIKVVREIRNQQVLYVIDESGEKTYEEVAYNDSWNYANILWNDTQNKKAHCMLSG